MVKVSTKDVIRKLTTVIYSGVHLLFGHPIWPEETFVLYCCSPNMRIVGHPEFSSTKNRSCVWYVEFEPSKSRSATGIWDETIYSCTLNKFVVLLVLYVEDEKYKLRSNYFSSWVIYFFKYHPCFVKNPFIDCCMVYLKQYYLSPRVTRPQFQCLLLRTWMKTCN